MGDTRFIFFIFNDNDNEQISKKQWEDAYTSFKGNPSQMSGFLENRNLSGSFIAGFEVYGLRIARFVQLIPQHNNLKARNKEKEELDLQLGKLVGGHVIRKIIIPLLDQRYQHLHTRDALLELLFSTVALADRSIFDQLAARLGKAPALLGRLISDQRSDKLMGDWIDCVRSSKETMQDWIEVSMDLTKNCESDHRVLSEMERWDLLTTLKLHLQQAYNPVASSQRKHSVGTLPSGSRASGSNGTVGVKGRRVSYTPAAIAPGISQDCIALLRQLKITIPSSVRAIRDTIVHIETNETFPILEALLKSFSCRLCFMRGYGNISEAIVSPVHTEFESQENALDADSFEGLLGGGLGVWKIALSTQALRDLKQSGQEGNIDHIKKKLEALASGDWVRGAVAGEVSKNHGDHSFRVPVYKAFYGGNGRILWQVDVGFDEKCNADSQIVRVWRIGDVKEIHNSLGSVYRAQKGFSLTRVERCKMKSIDKQRGIKVPVVFDAIDQEERDKLESIDERLPEDMLISAKFHTLTGTVLESILRGQPHSDFPFDVTGKEVEIIKNKNATFILGRSGTGKTSCLLYKLMSRYLARNIAQPETPIRQILLTRSEPLARKLESEVQLLIDSQLHRMKAGFNYLDDGMDISLEIRDGMEEDTTEDFFSLRKENFPFVCTFGHFLKRLENTIRGNDRRAGVAGKSRRLVDYVIFKEAYWVHFPSSTRGGLEPDLVFAEIMGVIKGAASLLTGLKPLSKEEYRTTSARLAPTFAKTADRDTVYRIFERYESTKANNGDYDGIDRVRTIIGELNENVSLKRKLESIFEEVYVDEVQDQRPLEIELLLNLVQNPRGIHFAGDSAQCISKDSTFRFANLKALFFNHFSASRFTRIDPSAAKPELFSLSRNFRSHQGILSLASFVMELLWKGFPDMVDKLPPEIGQYLGPKPVIFIGSDLVEFLQMAGKRTGVVGNPAVESPQDGSPAKQVSNQQIIIIRDHQDQEELQSKLGGGSLVFTVLQSKGMEYDDVFLYNFFSSSPCLKAFQSLQELLVSGANPSYGASHMSMCSELKSLYVAITRPRNRLWILESDPGFIPELLTQRVPLPLVDIKPFNPGEILFMMEEVRPTTVTTEREWIETGDQCMDRGLFEQALRCYNNADDWQKITLATACIAEQKGKECQARGDGIHTYFKDASDNFIKLNLKERAASCLEADGAWEAAAHLYRERGKHEKAAGLFEKARMYEEAAGQYHLSNRTLNALQSLHKGKLYERLVEDVSKYRHKIGDGDRKSYARECNMLLRRKNKPPFIRPYLWELTFNMFTSDLEKEEFLAEFEYKVELLKFYLERGRLQDAFLYSTDTGEVDTALSLMIDRVENSGDVWEWRHLQDIFSHSQTGRVLSQISTSSAIGVDLSCEERFWGNGWSYQWKKVATVAGQYFKNGNKLDRHSIEEEWTRDYMDTTVSINVPYFLKFKEDFDLGDLPTDYISGLQEMIKGVMSGSKVLSKATLCALGLLHHPGKDKPYITLNWSPLLRGAKNAMMFEFDEMSEAVVDYLSGQINSACSLIQGGALLSWNDLLKQENCRSCVNQVGWDRPEKVGIRGPKCSHISVPRVRFERSMQGLLSIITSFIKLPEEYFTLQDELLNILFTKLTYRSSFFEAAEAIARVRGWLRTAEASGVLEKLQDHFLQRWAVTIHLDIGSKYDFVSLLGNYQPARCLDLEQYVLNEAFTGRPSTTTPKSNQGGRKRQEAAIKSWGSIFAALAYPGKSGNNSRAPERPQDFVYRTLKQYHSLHRWENSTERMSVGKTSEKMDSLLQSLSDLSRLTQCLSFYHESVITIYEEMLTFLLFSIKKTDVVIPESWVELHLPRWEQFLRACTEMEQYCYQRMLLRVISGFCDWIIKLESASQASKSRESRALARRSVDLLVVSLINIGTAGALPVGYQEMWSKVQKVFGFQSLGTSSILKVQPKDLVKPLTRAFKHYNGKDTILVYVREGRTSRRVEAWRGTGAQFRSMPMRRNPPYWPSGGRSACGVDVIYLYGETDGIYLIQAWYRRQKANLDKHNSHMRSPTGQGVPQLYKFCKSHEAEFSSRQMFLEFVAVIMVEGLELYLAVNVLFSQIRAMKKIGVARKFQAKADREINSYETKVQAWSDLFSLDMPITLTLEASACQKMLKKELALCKELGGKVPESTRWLQKPFSVPAPTQKVPAQKAGPVKDRPNPAQIEKEKITPPEVVAKGKAENVPSGPAGLMQWTGKVGRILKGKDQKMESEYDLSRQKNKRQDRRDSQTSYTTPLVQPGPSTESTGGGGGGGGVMKAELVEVTDPGARLDQDIAVQPIPPHQQPATPIHPYYQHPYYQQFVEQSTPSYQQPAMPIPTYQQPAMPIPNYQQPVYTAQRDVAEQTPVGKTWSEVAKLDVLEGTSLSPAAQEYVPPEEYRPHVPGALYDDDGGGW